MRTGIKRKLVGHIDLIVARSQARRREKQGYKPHTCFRCGRKLGMSEAHLAHGEFWCKPHRPRDY